MKRQASERFHGRRGGGYTDEDAGQRLADLRRHRLERVTAGDWPEHSLEEWRRLADEGDLIGIQVMRADRDARANHRGRYDPKAKAK